MRSDRRDNARPIDSSTPRRKGCAAMTDSKLSTPAIRHSETPWVMSRRNSYGFDVFVSSDARHDVAGRLIAAVNDSYGTGEADAHLIAAAPELLGEHRAWAEMFGEALSLVLQGDYSKVDALACAVRFEFPNGAPVLKSEAIAKAEPRE